MSLALFTLNHTTALSPINSAAYEVYVAAYALLRVSRDVWTAALMVADYSWTLWGLEGEERRQRLEECHWRNADRLKRCFNANGGSLSLHAHSAHTLQPDCVGLLWIVVVAAANDPCAMCYVLRPL